MHSPGKGGWMKIYHRNRVTFITGGFCQILNDRSDVLVHHHSADSKHVLGRAFSAVGGV